MSKGTESHHGLYTIHSSISIHSYYIVVYISAAVSYMDRVLTNRDSVVLVLFYRVDWSNHSKPAKQHQLRLTYDLQNPSQI
jgi:hypothetical protein